MYFRRATGFPIIACKEYLRTADPDLVQRILLAYDRQSASEPNRHLHDPLEDDPLYAHVFAEAETETQREIAAIVEEKREALRTQGQEHLEFLLGGPLPYWKMKKRILKERYHIDWKTPAEMNPGECFD